MACSTTRLVPSRLGLGFFLVLERVGMAHSGTSGTEPSRSAIFKLTHYPLVEGRVASSLTLAQSAIALPGSAFEIRRTRQSHVRTSFREVVKILLTAGQKQEPIC